MNAHASETFFIFAHGGLQYALPVTQVVEIVEMPALLPSHGRCPAASATCPTASTCCPSSTRPP